MEPTAASPYFEKQYEDLKAELRHISVMLSILNDGLGNRERYRIKVDEAKNAVSSHHDYMELLREWDSKANMKLVGKELTESAKEQYFQVHSTKLKAVEEWKVLHENQLKRAQELEELESRLPTYRPSDYDIRRREFTERAEITRRKQREMAIVRVRREHIAFGDTPPQPQPPRTECDKGQRCLLLKRFYAATSPDELQSVVIEHMKSRFHADDPRPECPYGSACGQLYEFRRKPLEELKLQDEIIRHMQSRSHPMLDIPLF